MTNVIFELGYCVFLRKRPSGFEALAVEASGFSVSGADLSMTPESRRCLAATAEEAIAGLASRMAEEADASATPTWRVRSDGVTSTHEDKWEAIEWAMDLCRVGQDVDSILDPKGGEWIDRLLPPAVRQALSPAKPAAVAFMDEWQGMTRNP